MSKISVFGIYQTRRQLENVVEELKASGFRNTDISVLFPQNEGTRDLVFERNTKAPEGATGGFVSGGAIGGVLGWLAGIGVLAIPGLGPFIASGPLMSALSGLAVGGALGIITGALIGMGISEYEAKQYAGRVQKGCILLSIRTDNFNCRDRAKRILEETGAEDVGSSLEARGERAARVTKSRL
jgi:hypothetical protein